MLMSMPLLALKSLQARGSTDVLADLPTPGKNEFEFRKKTMPATVVIHRVVDLRGLRKGKEEVSLRSTTYNPKQ